MRHARAAVRSVFVVCGLACAAAAPAAEVSPMPAEIAPYADDNLLTAIARVGEQRLVVVGSRGHILLSDDAGMHWRQVASPVNSLLTQVSFLDASTGWAVGHDAVVLKTVDGGETWTLKHFAPDQEALLDVMFLDAQRGLALGAYGTLLQSADGGETWTAVENALTEEGMHLNAIARLNDGRLLVVGEAGLIASSNDDGRTWLRGEFSYEGSLFAVKPDGEHGAIVAGMRGNAFRSADVMANVWEAIPTDSRQSVFGIGLRNGGYLLAGFNSSMIAVGVDGSVGALPLQPVNNGDADAGDAGMFSDAVAFADLLVLDNSDVITVGDAGVKRWSVGP